MSNFGQVGGQPPVVDNKENKEVPYDWEKIVAEKREVIKAELESATPVENIPDTNNNWKLEKVFSEKDDSASQVRIGYAMEDRIPGGVQKGKPLRMNLSKLVTGVVSNIRETEKGEYLVETASSSIYKLTEIPRIKKSKEEIEAILRWREALRVVDDIKFRRQDIVSIKKIGSIKKDDKYHDAVDVQNEIKVNKGALLAFRLGSGFRFGAVEPNNQDKIISFVPQQVCQDARNENIYLVKTGQSYYEIKIETEDEL